MDYEHGLPFSEKLAENLDDLLERIDNKKAVLIIIDGGVGEGKTTLLVHILNYINKKCGYNKVKLDGCQLAMGGVDFLRKLRECYENNLPCIGYDEAGDFNKRSSLTNFNAMMNRTFETFRAFKCIVVIALPNFDVLDNQLFDNRIPRMLIHLSGRSKKYGNFDAYDLRNMEWLKYWIKKSPIKAYAWQKVHPNFYGHFLDLDPSDSKELDKVSTKNKLNILRKSEIRIEGLLSYAELANKLNKSIQWVKKAIRDLKIKHDRLVSKAKYFNQNVLDQLTDHADYISQNDKRGGNRYNKK